MDLSRYVVEAAMTCGWICLLCTRRVETLCRHRAVKHPALGRCRGGTCVRYQTLFGHPLPVQIARNPQNVLFGEKAGE